MLSRLVPRRWVLRTAVAVHLVDHSRTDPGVPTGTVRELMVQIWYPARRPTGQPVAAWQTRNALAHFEHERGIPSGVLRWPDTHARWVLADAVRTVHSGGWHIESGLAAEAIRAGDNPLTPREAQVLALAGGTSRDVHRVTLYEGRGGLPEPRW